MGIDKSRPGTDDYDLLTTSLERASSGFNHVTTDIEWAYTSRGSGNNGTEDEHNWINSRVYKGGKVSS